MARPADDGHGRYAPWNRQLDGGTEGIDSYQQRADACFDPQLKDVMGQPSK
jgi:hypothetical protein